jgi:hypothetical protein
MAKKPLPLGTRGQIWTKPVHHDAKAGPTYFRREPTIATSLAGRVT